MKITNSLKTLKKRDKNCVVRRKGAGLRGQQGQPPVQGAPGRAAQAIKTAFP
jgi:hypothetical protein